MRDRNLEKEFKDEDNPFRIVFVCAMWLTGFDVKCLSVLYLDKPLKAHTLMQTIARANRVHEGKTNGLIVAYADIVESLKRALADYANSGKSVDSNPLLDKRTNRKNTRTHRRNHRIPQHKRLCPAGINRRTRNHKTPKLSRCIKRSLHNRRHEKTLRNPIA